MCNKISSCENTITKQYYYRPKFIIKDFKMLAESLQTKYSKLISQNI